MPLTDTAIRNAKPGEKPFRLFDGGGLYLEVSPTGGKWWRLKYRFNGKEKRLSLGVYHDVSLKDARDRRDGVEELPVRRMTARRSSPGIFRRGTDTRSFCISMAMAERWSTAFRVFACLPRAG